MNWLNQFQTRHEKAFNVASAIHGDAASVMRDEVIAALQNGDGFGEFRQRLSKEFSPLLTPQG